ncbi:NUDIX hydrolase [Phenylobacterium aquaticum]|uniref:NUDIX hydrolase n=1 Tax=Phenylobacterium aquaticum TaxID=1763816 RepID=UPI0026EB3F49|nr:NUDIX domain-containing protein [Phenylobacterium aquaticum]
MSETSALRHRPTARVLLFDAEGRILLMKGRLPNRPAGTSAWFTVGGGLEPGESLEVGALREIAEETGFTEVELGPVVWLREGVGALASGETVLFRETYVVARCAGGEVSRAGWEAHEIDLVDDLRWWTFDELVATDERVYPERLLELLPDVLAGRYPAEPLVITVVRPPR